MCYDGKKGDQITIQMQRCVSSLRSASVSWHCFTHKNRPIGQLHRQRNTHSVNRSQRWGKGEGPDYYDAQNPNTQQNFSASKTYILHSIAKSYHTYNLQRLHSLEVRKRAFNMSTHEASTIFLFNKENQRNKNKTTFLRVTSQPFFSPTFFAEFILVVWLTFTYRFKPTLAFSFTCADK